jgi:predicted SprT family Zn-dependent metalloprotease
MSAAVQLNFFRELTRLLRPTAPAPATPALPAEGSDAALIIRARSLLAALGCDALAEKVCVIWNPRMRSTAGTAHAGRSLITLNPKLRAFGSDEVDRTLRHELAHLLAHHRAGRRRISAHGPEWRKACRDLGLGDEKRCHALPLPTRTMRPKHFYECPGCRVTVARVRVLRRKSACLACCRQHNGGRYDGRFQFVKLRGSVR